MTRSRRFRLTLMAVLVTLLFLSVAALATGKPGKPNPGKGKGAQVSATQYQGQPKVTICHKGKTIRVAQPAVRAHLRHGDRVGPC
jgi:hypothetical protein